MKHSLPSVYYVYYGKEDELLTQFPRDGFMRQFQQLVMNIGWMYTLHGD